MDERRLVGGHRSIVLGALVLVLVAAAVSATLVVVAQQREVSQPIADLVPADTHFYVALNTDLTSPPWIALPRLLQT